MTDSFLGFYGKLRTKVEYCLQNFEETRNNDKELYIQLFKKFYPQYVVNDAIKLSDFEYLPSFEGIVRLRREIQEQRRYPPTREEVALARKWAVDEWRKLLGYSQ